MKISHCARVSKNVGFVNSKIELKFETIIKVLCNENVIISGFYDSLVWWEHNITTSSGSQVLPIPNQLKVLILAKASKPESVIKKMLYTAASE